MKIQKLLIIASIFCLLLGASGAVMAQTNNCPDGRLLFQTFPDGLTLNGEDCVLSNVMITGDLRVRNGGGHPGIDVLIRNSKVQGTIRIRDIRGATVLANEVSNGDVVIRDTEKIVVGDNILQTTGPGQGGPVVGQQKILIRTGAELQDVTLGFVFNNQVLQGVIDCRPLEGPDVFTQGNTALDISCIGQVFE